MKKYFLLFTFLLLLLITIISCSGGKKTEEIKEEVTKVVYVCPMKCNNGQTYDKAGTCPVCGMELEKSEKI